MRVHYDSPWFPGLLPPLLRSDPWYGRLRGDINSLKSREERKLPGNLLVHDDARVLQPRRAVTDGKARYKNWVRVFVPQECGLHTFPLFTLYSRLSSPANLLPASRSLSERLLYPSSPPSIALCIRTYAPFRRPGFVQNLRAAKSVNYFINLLVFTWDNLAIRRSSAINYMYH